MIFYGVVKCRLYTELDTFDTFDTFGTRDRIINESLNIHMLMMII